MQHANGSGLRLLNDLLQIMNGCTGHADRFQTFKPMRGGVGTQDLGHGPKNLGLVLHAQGIAGESRIARPLRKTHFFGEFGEESVIGRSDDHFPVTCLEGLEDHHLGITAAVTFGLSLRDRKRGKMDIQPAQRRLEKRGVHLTAQAC